MARYPTIYIHGFMGYGEDDFMDKVMPMFGFRYGRRLIPYLRKQGYEVYNPSLGPFNSAWDRACIIYAYLFGGTVDFGKVHSEKYGHARYGETYPGVIKDLGTPGPHAKINVVGHSFGGPTVLAFVDLMTNGFAEEREGTPEEELSPLFAGGHGDLIHTATTLSGVNNGTLLSDGVNGNGRIRYVAGALFNLMIVVGDVKPVRKFLDFKFDHWGIMEKRCDLKKSRLKKTKDYKENLETFLQSSPDDIGEEMKIVYAKEINDMRGPLGANTYYFARRAVKSHDIGDGTYRHAMNMGCFPVLCQVACLVTGRFIDDNLKENYGVTLKEWAPNDGFVNLPGQSAPFNQPYTDAETLFDDDYQKAIWYNMPVEYKDHLSWAGPLEPTKKYFQYNLNMQKLFERLPD